MILTVLLIIAVIVMFNAMICVHELGHFLAARWRGLYVDRFQVWFGKPLWKKKVGGVEYGIGWIPAGGFVSLPQMAPMEAIEGESDLPKDLPPIKPLDKVIVAFAGPLFSFLLALFFAFVVSWVGKTDVQLNTTTIGYMTPDSPAAQAGLLPGDKIIEIDGSPVSRWSGNMVGVREKIMLSEKEAIEFTVQRPGVEKPLVFYSGYKIPETSWWQRKALREVGLVPASQAVIQDVFPDSPASKSGLEKGDVITSLNGQKIWSPLEISEKSQKGVSMTLTYVRGDSLASEVTVTPELPLNADSAKITKPLLGLSWGIGEDLMKEVLEYPSPWSQIGQSLKWMKLTLEKVIAPGSDVGVQHLSGPVGIGNQFYQLLSSPNGWRMALWFAVVLNINLAVLNLLPLPVVDGGHIVLGFIEKLVGKPVGGDFLGFVQTAFAFVLMGFFIFVTFKDVGDLFGRDKIEKQEPPIFTK